MRKWAVAGILGLALVLVVIVSGCTSPLCQPDWVFGYQQTVYEGVPRMTEESCKAGCYAAAGTTKFKVERNIPMEVQGVREVHTVNVDKCYCDVNNC